MTITSNYNNLNYKRDEIYPQRINIHNGLESIEHNNINDPSRFR
jgi:hypothetical protein